MSATRRGFLVRVLGCSWSLFTLVALAACSSDPSSPEAQIRALFAMVEVAIEERDIKPVKEVISEGYRDSRGRDKNTFKGVLAAHFLRNRAIFLLTRVDEIAIGEDGHAHVVLLAAMTGVPIERLEALLRMPGSFYRIEFELVTEDDEWKIQSVNERRVNISDFLD